MIDNAKMKALRTKRKKSLEDVSRDTQLSVQTVHRIESGKTPNPGIDAVLLIAKSLSVDITELIKN